MNYKNNFTYFINLKDDKFLDEKTSQLISYYKKINKDEKCIENITFYDALPYLMKKPTCTKYWASWLASPIIIQKKYINEIKRANPKFVLYSSANLKFDGLGIYERIELVDSFITSNYEKYNDVFDYIILKKK